MSPFGGIATIVPASDYVSTFRGEGVEPDLVALAVADHVLTLRGRDVQDWVCARREVLEESPPAQWIPPRSHSRHSHATGPSSRAAISADPPASLLICTRGLVNVASDFFDGIPGDRDTFGAGRARRGQCGRAPARDSPPPSRNAQDRRGACAVERELPEPNRTRQGKRE